MKVDYNILWKAWKEVEAKNAQGGIDTIQINDFKEDATHNINKMLIKLKEHAYLPQPYLQVKIPKNEHEFRTLGLATVMDKIVQQAILNFIEPQIEPSFLQSSYAYRPDKGPLKALKQIKHLISNQKLYWLAKCDIDNFFDSLSHERLRKLLKPFLKDTFFFELVFMFCKMGYVNHQLEWKDRDKGVPQGALLSPILANLYLSGLDQKMNQQQIGYIRYADDFIILAKTEEEAKNTLKEVEDYLSKRLQLVLNEGAYIKPVESGFKFLGVWVNKEGFSLQEEKIQKLQDKISNAINSTKFLSKYPETLQGIIHYYGKLVPQHLLFPIDEHQKEVFYKKIEQIKSIKTNKAVSLILENLQFITPHFEKNKAFHKEEILLKLQEKRKAKKITSAEQAVKKRKREYELKATENHEIVITGFGKSVGIAKNNLTIKENAKIIQTIALHNVEHIAIQTNACNISSKLIEYCAEKKIPIDFLDFSGEPYAKIFSPLNDTYKLWYQQFIHLQTEEAVKVAKSLIIAKIKNQIKLMKYYGKYAKYHEKDLPNALETAAEKITHLIKIIKTTEAKHIEQLRPQLIGWEAQASIHYWDIVRVLIDEETTFQTRRRKGATDLVNSMLNYGYSILYRHVWGSLLRQGLNPTFSYIHTPQKFEGTLVFDFIEPFRQPIVDRAVISMINKKTKLEVKNGQLADDTKKKLIEAVNDRIRRYDIYLGERLNYIEIIKKQAQHYSHYLMGRQKEFKPYQMSKW